MTRDDIIKLAREVGYPLAEYDGEPYVPPMLALLLETVAAAEREHLLSTSVHSCHANCQRFACVQTRNAVEAEREACIDDCNAEARDDGTAQRVVERIRARGNT